MRQRHTLLKVLKPEQKQNVLNMLLKDYGIMRQEIRNCHSLYYKLAFGFGITGIGVIVLVAEKCPT